jgi:hypothetical protein
MRQAVPSGSRQPLSAKQAPEIRCGHFPVVRAEDLKVHRGNRRQAGLLENRHDG